MKGVSDKGHKTKAYQGSDTYEYTVSPDHNGVRLTIAAAVESAGFEAGETVKVIRGERELRVVPSK